MTGVVERGPGGGLPCPECGTVIPIRISQLLSETSFRCAACGLVLTLDRAASAPSLAALEQLHKAFREAEAVKDRYR